MEIKKENESFSWFNFADILDSSKIGLWSIEINNVTGVNKLYCNDIMISLIGAKENLTPEKYFEFWYSRIHKGYYSYIEKAFEKVCTSNQAVEIQYPWQHPKLGDIIVRSHGKVSSRKSGVIVIKGYHQNINDLNQMKVVLSKIENEIFEWYQDSNTAYIHTNYNQLYKNDANIENFPYSWIENGTVQIFFKNTFLSAFERIRDGDKKAVCELKMKNKEGRYSWFRMILSKEDKYSEMSNVVVGTIENIDKLKEMEISYVVESRFYKAILKEMIAYGEFNLTNYKFINTGGLWSCYNEVIDKLNILEIVREFALKDIHEEDRQKYLDIISYGNLIESYYTNKKSIKCELRRKISQDNIRWIEFTCTLFKEPYKMDILGLFYIKDIDDRKRQEIILRHNSKIDGLTNIYNKNAFREIVEDIIKEANENDNFAMLIIDVDNFKDINDNYGHSTGDEVLIYISTKLKEIFSKEYEVSRFGGDEFVVFTKNPDKFNLENKLSEFFYELINFAKFKITCSIGVCISTKKDYDEIFNLCDSALYHVKKSGKKGYAHWTNDADEVIEDKNTILKEEIFPFGIIKEPNIIEIEQKQKDYENLDDVISSEGSIAYIIDPSTYKIIKANQAFYNMIKKRPEDCEGVECYKLLHNKTKPCSFCKNIFWNSKEFFVWKRYNKKLNQDFILKNKIIKFKGKNVMFTLATALSFAEENNANGFTGNISKLLTASMYQLSKKESFDSNINTLLELIMEFFNSKSMYMFNFNSQKQIETHSISPNEKKYDIAKKLLKIVETEFLYNPIQETKYILGKQEAISISYNLYLLMSEYHFFNILIIPLKNKNHIVGYLIGINNHNFEEYTYLENFEEYSKNISYLISEEIFKNNLLNELKSEKTYDSLTGLLSRNDYREYEKEYKPDNVSNIGIICLALNELNNINHTAGILAGDEILLTLANVLKEQFVKMPIFRLNGNEFLVIMENIEYEIFLNKIDLLIKRLEKIGLSITYGKVWTSEEKELNRLVNYVIYLRKKESQKNNQLDSSNNLYKRNKLFKELMLSIENKEYEVFMQPKINLKTGKLSGAEALIRKKNNEGGYVPPDKFIPILEHHYLIQYIDLFVFEEVFKQMEEWQKQDIELFPVSLNFSRRTLLEDDLLKTVETIKNRYNVDPKYIEIEVTESVGDLEKEAICMVLKQLENLGFLILLDDFGVKYSNLSILSEAKFHGLKLDKSMVKNLGYNITNEIIMKNVVCMCKDLQIKTIAEGVETPEQEEILKNMDCDIGQGYLYSKPISIKEFEKKYL